jgi:Skp family chaperone for outer membrane proteins
LERDIRAEQRKMEEDQQEAKQRIAKLSDERTVALYKKVREAAARYATAHNIDLVLHYSDVTPDDPSFDSPMNITRKMQAGSVMPLYWRGEMDISKAVVAAMNAQYRSAAGPGGGVSRDK